MELTQNADMIIISCMFSLYIFTRFFAIDIPEIVSIHCKENMHLPYLHNE